MVVPGLHTAAAASYMVLEEVMDITARVVVGGIVDVLVYVPDGLEGVELQNAVREAAEQVLAENDKFSGLDAMRVTVLNKCSA